MSARLAIVLTVSSKSALVSKTAADCNVTCGIKSRVTAALIRSKVSCDFKHSSFVTIDTPTSDGKLVCAVFNFRISSQVVTLHNHFDEKNFEVASDWLGVESISFEEISKVAGLVVELNVLSCVLSSLTTSSRV